MAKDYGVESGRKKGFYEYTALTGRKLRMMIGLSSGEVGRRLKKQKDVPLWMGRTVERVYPLVEMGWDGKRCQEYILGSGFPLPVPSLCRRCPYKGELDVLRMSRDDPEGFTEWVELERNKLDAHSERFPHLPEERNHGVFGANTTLPDVLAKAEEKYGHLSDEELDGMRMEGHAVGSKY